VLVYDIGCIGNIADFIQGWGFHSLHGRSIPTGVGIKMANKELEVIVKELESGEVNLDEAIEKYTKAMKLAKECSDKLNKATEKVNKILKENGTLEEFKVEE
jgi:exodeoxyribonuclease VII small subunit